MTIRTKVSLAFFTALTLCACLVSGAFLFEEARQLRIESSERTLLWFDSASKIAEESVAAQDDLLLVSYLDFLMRDRPGIVQATIRKGAKTLKVGPGLPKGETDPLVMQKEIPPLTFEMIFSRRLLEKGMNQAFSRALKNSARATLLICFAGFWISLALGRMLAKPISAISRAMEDVKSGNLGARVGLSGQDELGKLASQFDEMSQKLLEVDRMKKEFVASVTHELKSPLGAIESYSRLMGEDGALTPGQRENLKRIEENASRLSEFVTHLLEEARIERGTLDISPRASHLRPAVENTVLLFVPRARECGVDLVLEPLPTLPRVWMDPERIQQVFANLISNALKFTPRGGKITVSAQMFRHDKEDCVMCSVQDTGIGLSPEDCKRIFKPFERVRNEVHAPGVGLGLAITKHIIEQHGGTIRLVSKKGEGSRFYFTLPLASSVRQVSPASAGKERRP